MDRREYLMNMRKAGLLKGQKPCFISLKVNGGKIYNGGPGDFIMSYRNGILYFQRLSLIFKNLKPKFDFEIEAKRFIEYKFIVRNYMKTLCLYDQEGCYIEINYQTGTYNTASTEDNIQRIVDVLRDEFNAKLAEDN